MIEEIPRILGPEILFTPELYTFSGNNFTKFDGKGLHTLIFDSIKGSNPNLQTELYKNIVLCGGSTLFPGLSRRLWIEVDKLK